MSPFLARRTAGWLAAAGFAVVSLTGCTDSGSDTTTGSSPATSAATTPAPAGATPTAGTAASVAVSGKAVAAADLCSFLQKKVPAWKAVGGETGAQAQLAIDLFTFYQDQGAIPVGSAIDSETKTQCPDVRAEVLQATGLESFLVL